MPRPVKKKKSNGKSWGLMAGIGLPVLGVAGFFAFNAIRHNREQTKAQNDVDILRIVIVGYSHEHGDYPNGDFLTICRLLQGEAVGEQNTSRKDYVSAESYEKNAKGEFVDPWGTPYCVRFNGSLQVYSWGPNRADDKGQGDDIVANPNAVLN